MYRAIKCVAYRQACVYVVLLYFRDFLFNDKLPKTKYRVRRRLSLVYQLSTTSMDTILPISMLSYDAHKRCSKTTIHVQFSLQKYLDSYNLESNNINLKCQFFLFLEIDCKCKKMFFKWVCRVVLQKLQILHCLPPKDLQLV